MERKITAESSLVLEAKLTRGKKSETPSEAVIGYDVGKVGPAVRCGHGLTAGLPGTKTKISPCRTRVVNQMLASWFRALGRLAPMGQVFQGTYLPTGQ